jgi:hypothetical protein
MLADHDALIVGNGQQSPIVVMTLDAWGRLTQIPAPPR